MYKVKVSGLKSKPEFNGQVATLVNGKGGRKGKGPGRFVVRFEDGSQFALKRSNLQLINPDQHSQVERLENALEHHPGRQPSAADVKDYGAGMFAKERLAKGCLIFSGQ